MRTPFSHVPDELKNGTVSLADADSLGVSRDVLRGSAWRHVGWGHCRWAAQGMDDNARLEILLKGLPEGSALAGLTAARCWGLDVPPPVEPEVIVPPGGGVSGRAAGTVRRVRLERGDVVLHHGLPVTSPMRTCFDLACGLPLVEAVVVTDQALSTGLVRPQLFAQYVGHHHKVRGVVQARRVLDLAEPRSESPMESRLRMFLMRAGLPCPEAQVSIFDPRGNFAGRVDLYYPAARVGIEYDGENHRDRMTADNQRQNHLLECGITLLRYTAPDLADRRDAVVAEVRSALRRRRPVAAL